MEAATMGWLRLLIRELTGDLRVNLWVNVIVATGLKLYLDLLEVYSRETCDGVLHRALYAIEPWASPWWSCWW